MFRSFSESSCIFLEAIDTDEHRLRIYYLDSKANQILHIFIRYGDYLGFTSFTGTFQLLLKPILVPPLEVQILPSQQSHHIEPAVST